MFHKFRGICSGFWTKALQYAQTWGYSQRRKKTGIIRTASDNSSWCCLRREGQSEDGDCRDHVEYLSRILRWNRVPVSGMQIRQNQGKPLDFISSTSKLYSDIVSIRIPVRFGPVRPDATITAVQKGQLDRMPAMIGRVQLLLTSF
jgi:hypothetical protein